MTSITDNYDRQARNEAWWQSQPMTYDWHQTLHLEPGQREWFEEVDRRFLESAYYARGNDGQAFGRFLHPAVIAGRSVLEVGCGMGTHAALLARLGAKLTAIDLTDRAVEMTKRRFQLFGLHGDIRKADAENLPFADGTFDFVWSWGVIHHSNSTERCVSEIARVVKPGGRVALMVYYRTSIARYIHCGLIHGVLFGKLRNRTLDALQKELTDGAYARLFTTRSLQQLLRPYFDNLACSVVGNKPELLPIPASGFKRQLESVMPDAVARSILGRWGSMIVIEGRRI